MRSMAHRAAKVLVRARAPFPARRAVSVRHSVKSNSGASRPTARAFRRPFRTLRPLGRRAFDRNGGFARPSDAEIIGSPETHNQLRVDSAAYSLAPWSQT